MGSGTWYGELSALQTKLKQGDCVTQNELDELARRWQARIPQAAQETETLLLVDDTGSAYEPALQAPRWLCHTLALRHACAHVLLIWDAPRLGPVFVCQVRSWSKKDFPGRIDISVGGHVVGTAGSRRTALMEMHEELGLSEADLTESGLTHIGGYECFVTVEEKQFYDVEWRDVYLGRIRSLDNLRFTDGEVACITLCPVAEAFHLLTQQNLAVANGLAMSLPLCLDYLQAHPTAGGTA
jgi:isopentenyldiphosphate isomerase